MILGLDQSERRARTDHLALKAVIDSRLDSLLPIHGRAGELGAAMRYSLLAPGKRIRPLLTIYTAWEFGPSDLAMLDAGCALEMIHAASLILDDMPAMDDAIERRGQPATHVQFGEDVAMLGAISLLSHAYATVGAMPNLDAAMRCALVGVLAKAVGVEGLAGGQHADLRQGRSSLGGVADANHRKTGALFVAAVEMAAVVRKVSPTQSEELRFCASELGQAFQLLDDLIDSVAFRSPGRQEDEGKATVLTMVGQDETRRRLDGHVSSGLATLRPGGVLANFVRSIFENGLVAIRAA